jgi:hypothetical protein
MMDCQTCDRAFSIYGKGRLMPMSYHPVARVFQGVLAPGRTGTFIHLKREIMFKNIKLVGLLSAVVIAATGCASVAMAPAEQDTKAKSFAVSAEKANVYIYRNESMGAAVKLEITVDGKLVGSTAAKSYFLVQLAPGKHTILSQQDPEKKLDLTVAAGKNYFVWQEVKMGMWSPGSKLSLVEDSVGKAGVAESGMIEAAK